MNNNKEYINDELKLYRGEDFLISKHIKIHQVTLGEICDYNEQDYFSLVYNFTATPQSLKVQLWDAGIDYTTITAYDTFCSFLCKAYSQEKTSILFGDLDFKKFDLVKKKDGSIALYQSINGDDVIIDEYTLTAQPVSSKVIVDKYFFNLSPQTIRNEMLYLEKIGLLEKTHTSSGRIPSLNGYKFYEMNILKPYLSNDVKNQLKVIFQKRDLSIDMIINESASLIEEILKLPTVVASQDSNVLLKRFDLIPITDQKVLLLLVTSNGDVIKNDISITNNKELDDVIICVKIFNDRLIDTPLNQITQKLSIIKEIIRCSVHEYEFVLQKIIKKIFDFNTAPQKHQVYGVKSLMSHPEFQNVDRLKSVLSLLDNASV